MNQMTTRAKILAGFLGAALACGAIAFGQERRQQSILDAVRGSLSTGDSKEKVQTVMRAHGLQPKLTADGNAYTAHVWFHVRRDVSIVIALNPRGEIADVSVRELVD